MYIFSLNPILLLTCTYSCEVGEIQKKRKEAMAKREEMGKRKGVDAYPFRWLQVIPVFSSSVSVQICVFQLVGDLASLQASLLAVSVDHCSISLESLFASSPLYSPIPWLALTSLSLTHCSVDMLGSPLTLLPALTYLNCSHNRQAQKRDKISMNNKQITYPFPYKVDKYSGT